MNEQVWLTDVVIAAVVGDWWLEVIDGGSEEIDDLGEVWVKDANKLLIRNGHKIRILDVREVDGTIQWLVEGLEI